jgi:hypothetical protein
VSWSVAFSPDNSMLAFGSGRAEGGEITLLRVPIREKLETIRTSSEVKTGRDHGYVSAKNNLTE